MAQRTARRGFDREIVEGPIPRAVWKLAWPTVLQNGIGGLQGIVDHTLVGHSIGYLGNAAIGVSWQIFLIVIVAVISIFSGMGILIARFAGAGDEDRVHRVLHQAILASLVMVVAILAPIGIFLAPMLLDWVHAAPEVKAQALPYLRTLFVFSFGAIFYFMSAGALRAVGDAKTPMRLGIVMTVLNVGLSVVLIRGLGPIPAFGTLGAAMGTVIAQGVAGGAALYLFYRGDLPIHLHGFTFRPDFGVIREILRFGLPAGLQGIAMNLGGVIMVGFVGSLPHSAASQAAYAVCYTQLFALIAWTSVGMMSAASVVAGQSLGAGKPERTRAVARTAAWMGLAGASVAGAVFLLFPTYLLGIFGIQEHLVIDIGRQLLSYLAVSGLFVTVALSYTGTLQGAGDTRSPLFITLFSQLLLPVALLTWLSHWVGLRPHYVWSVIVAGHAARCLLSILRFRQEKWREIEVDIDRGAREA